MEEQQLIVVKQLPLIEEHLKQLAIEIDEKVKTAKSLVCTEDNKQEIKKVRAELNKEFNELEIQRKSVKECILEPYMNFEETYKELVTNKYKEADKELKEKVDAIDNQLKSEKEKETREYFEEYKKSLDIDFIKFEDANIKVGLSDTVTSLKKKAKDFINRVNTDLATIMLQDNKEEILVEYKQNGFALNNALSTVLKRHKQLEEEKKKQEELINKRLEQERKATEQALNNFKVDTKMEEDKEIVKDSDDILHAPEVEEILTLKFTVRGTREKLRKLKEFLINGGFEYE